MPITVNLPNGAKASFPDGTTPDVMKAAIQKKFPPQRNASGSPDERSLPPSPINPVVDYASQGISGFNEGLANIAGFPVDAVTLGMNAGIAGLNKLFPPDRNLSGLITGEEPKPRFGYIENPVLGSEQIKQMIAPTIAPPSQGQGQQIVRRIGQELGATALPGMGPAMRSLRPLEVMGKELLTAGGSGLGAGLAEQVAPNNPVAEFGGQLAGGLTAGGLIRGVERAGQRAARPPAPPRAAPTVDELRDEKNAAYRTADNLGVAYAPHAYDTLLTNIDRAVQADHISPTRHAAASSFIQDMAARRGRPMSLTDLDQLRQEVRRDLITPSYGNPSAAADAHFGQIVLDHIDDFVMHAQPGDILAGNGRDAANAILQARSLNTRLRKTEVIQEALEKAHRRTDSTGSGGNINNAIRQNIRAILDSPIKRRPFTPEERNQMETLIRQNNTENLLRWVGKFAPGGNGLIGGLEILGTLHNPALAALPVAGMVAKGIADHATIRQAHALRDAVARGGRPPLPARAPALPNGISAEERARINAWLLSGAANQNPAAQPPLQITVRGGASR